MKNIVVFGCGFEGVLCYLRLEKLNQYHMMGLADNALIKQGKIAFGCTIKSMDELEELNKEKPVSVVIASNAWAEIGLELEEREIPIEAVWNGGKLMPYKSPMTFQRLVLSDNIRLYAGDVCDDIHMLDPNLWGLSINNWDEKHIRHDITNKYPLPDNCIDVYEAEHVLEHISYEKIVAVINEVYRILKPGGWFRIALPDYYSPINLRKSIRDLDGNIIFDPDGGGSLDANGEVKGGGHLWYPTYSLMNELLAKTKFSTIEFQCYCTEEGNLVVRDIDFSKGSVLRIQERNDEIHTMIIDLYK